MYYYRYDIIIMYSIFGIPDFKGENPLEAPPHYLDPVPTMLWVVKEKYKITFSFRYEDKFKHSLRKL